MKTPQHYFTAAGKDRAGFAAVITLIALGVSRTVIKDYMKTNTFTQERSGNFRSNRIDESLSN